MFLGIDTTVDVALALIDLASGNAYNWNTGRVEAAAALSMAHVRPTKPSPIAIAPAVPASGSTPALPAALHAHTKVVDCSNALDAYLVLSPVWYAVDAVTGVPTSVYAIDSNPAQLRPSTRSVVIQ